jgi:hypothetical protein
MGACLACWRYFLMGFQIIALQYTVMGKISQGKGQTREI